MCSRYSHIAARVFSILWLALSTYVKSLIMRWLAFISKRWLAEWLVRVIETRKIVSSALARGMACVIPGLHYHYSIMIVESLILMIERPTCFRQDSSVLPEGLFLHQV